MAHVFFSQVLNASPEDAWRIIGDFGSLTRWFPFVKKSVLRGGGPREIGSVRINTVADDSVVEERLLELSDRDRRVAYEIVAGNIPTTDYSATIQVHEVATEPTQCFIEWSANFDVDGDREKAIAWVRDDIFKTCLAELERVIADDSSALSRLVDETQSNRRIVREAFEAWASGGTRFFDILAEEVEWTISGSGPSAQTFKGKQAFMAAGYGPIADCFVKGMKPEVIGLYAEHDEVIIQWDGIAEMKDGQTYRNSYAWFFRMRGGRVVKATAFLDLPTYDAALSGRPLPAWPRALPTLSTSRSSSHEVQA